MQKNVHIDLKKINNNSYDILISSHLNLAKEIKKINLNNNFAIITDDNVYKLYKDKIINEFFNENINYKFFIVKHGEKSKCLKVLQKISEKMLKSGFDRNSTIIALGGGVIGDLAGYIAGTFMRGISFIQVPTTLLAQVDSGIGGKVAVDIKFGKNSSGLFYQPKKVIIDIDFLNTLPDIEFNNGMAEIIKHGIIYDDEYFNFIEKNLSKIVEKKHDILIELIYGSCIIKGDVIEKDEKEKNLRRILNFGHTIGHGLEILSNYKLKHGYAVAFGIIKESYIANKLGGITLDEFNRIKNIINKFHKIDVKYNKFKLLDVIKNDKKNVKNSKLELIVPLVLPQKIGKVKITNFSADELIKYL